MQAYAEVKTTIRVTPIGDDSHPVAGSDNIARTQ